MTIYIVSQKEDFSKDAEVIRGVFTNPDEAINFAQLLVPREWYDQKITVRSSPMGVYQPSAPLYSEYGTRGSEYK